MVIRPRRIWSVGVTPVSKFKADMLPVLIKFYQFKKFDYNFVYLQPVTKLSVVVISQIYISH
jgi:hypothetical protein